jgi:hypothetical protein
MLPRNFIFAVCLVGVAFASVERLGAEDPPKQEPQAELQPAKAAEQGPQISPEQQRLFDKFRETLSSADLVGQYTVVGKEDRPPREERYSIKTVSKMAVGDLWLFTARIRYGDKDVTVPMPLEVKWAGETPIITLANVTIPGLGTFDSRVVIHDGMYAGTWRHGAVHGHLFGKIEKTAEGEPAEPSEEPKQP